MPTLLIFDCDGTLIDSERLYNLAWADVLGRHGLPWTVDECAQRLMGRPLPDCYAIIEAALGRRLPADFQSEVFAASDRWFAREGLQVIDGVQEALARLPQAKCVASSGLYTHVRDNLAQTGLLGYFGAERIFTAAMVARGKPAPDVFLHAARAMGAAPRDCIVIEDSVPGVLGGRAAGMRVLGYGGNQHDPAALRAAGAEVFDNMRALPALIG
ncbi:HAD family phosphatase [Vineibacter terrae]|uniref:HAD family phosphatase n=1 Tax=Vineibacter terrae TaxID=2586908 RepID=A0A5C8PDU4_9HYPH|nr:HAD family phosphatase [Vineibacter terrae]TXL71305.1 HAD family phosphatase [Vineibacter terrae]